MMRSSLVVILWIIHFYGQAQHFNWSAPVGKPEEEGFHAIPVPPKVAALSKEDFSDLRLFDGQGKEVPYLRRKDELSFDKRFFRPFEGMSKEIVKGCCTKVTVENPTRKEYSSFCLLIKNHELYKTAVLRGSDDKNNWFAVVEGITLSPIQSVTETFGASYLSFPLSNYAYFQLEINDSTAAPLNILEVGEYESETELGKWDTLTAPQISQADSLASKSTFIQLHFDAPYAIERMDLQFVGPKFFSRNATLYAVQKDARNKEWQQYLQTFQVSSKGLSSILLPPTRTEEYRILIENGDNPSVRLKSVAAAQLHTYLLAYLEKDIPYTLQFGQKELQAPQYDLSAFADSIPTQLTEMKVGALVHHDKMNVEVEKEPFFKTKWWIWTAIGAVLILLVWMSAKMLKEMGGGNN